jgi:hypothetical protein
MVMLAFPLLSSAQGAGPGGAEPAAETSHAVPASGVTKALTVDTTASVTPPASASKTSNQAPPSIDSIKAMIDRLARQYGLDPLLVHALVRAESGYDPQAVSPAGALGLMQLMPATAADYGVTSPERLFESELNLRVGMRHLRRLIDHYGRIGLAIMAYNAGEGALEESRGAVRYPETQRYTHRVLTEYLIKKGIMPYSPRAVDHLGIVLTPEMANAGARAAPSPAMIRPVASLGEDFTRFDSRYAEPSVQRRGPMPSSPRLEASRLSTRLENPANSLLQSRLFDSRKGARHGAGQQNQGVELLER